MKHFKLLGYPLISWGEDTPQAKPEPNVTHVQATKNPVVFPLTRGSDQPMAVSSQTAFNIDLPERMKLIKPDTDLELIPLLRKLVKYHPDLSQALSTVVELCNTGHTVSFDDSVKTDDINEMREELMENKGNWAQGQADVGGLVNKMVSQLIIGGAISCEWVPNENLDGVDQVFLVNPEEIRWVYDTVAKRYLPYQKVNPFGKSEGKNLIPLNTETYKYFALNGDTELPYGHSPYLASLESISIQKNMIENIRFIVDTIGIMGFLEVIQDKPDQLASENDAGYEARLQRLLEETRKNLEYGLRTGISVGYKGDTEYSFHPTTKNIDGLDKLYQLNELNLISGIKMDPALLGRAYSTTETQIGVVFTKLLSQLKNMQTILAAMLEFGYTLHLKLRGYKFKKLKVTFNEPTALDKLKEEQAQEIRIRNLSALYKAGIISQDQFAHSMGYSEPDEKEPRFISSSDMTVAEAKAKREAEKDASDRKSREKKNPTTKVKRS